MTDSGWIVLKTQVRHELFAAGAMLARAIESYVPLIEPKRPNDPAVPLFPGYVFARVTAASEDLVRIRSAPGIVYVLPRGAVPIVVPDEIVEVVRARLAQFQSGSGRPALRHGERVQLTDGPFRWLDAVFDRRLSATGRVIILLELAERTVRMNVEESLLKRV